MWMYATESLRSHVVSDLDVDDVKLLKDAAMGDPEALRQLVRERGVRYAVVSDTGIRPEFGG